MKTSVLALLAMTAYAVADDDHHKPTSSDCDENEGPTSVPTFAVPTFAVPTFTIPHPTWGGAWTTSTIYSTSTSTVISCGPEVKNCPAHSTVATTVIVPVSTTVCPVTEAAPPTVTPPAPPVASPPPAAPPVVASSSWIAPPPAVSSSWQAPPPPVVTDSATPVAPAPPAPTTFKMTSVGTITPPSKTAPLPPIVTAGANHNVQRAGGALVVALAAAALL